MKKDTQWFNDAVLRVSRTDLAEDECGFTTPLHLTPEQTVFVLETAVETGLLLMKSGDELSARRIVEEAVAMGFQFGAMTGVI